MRFRSSFILPVGTTSVIALRTGMFGHVSVTSCHLRACGRATRYQVLTGRQSIHRHRPAIRKPAFVGLNEYHGPVRSPLVIGREATDREWHVEGMNR
ncbi:hypothetical protein MHM582_3501 [Microbacterium sp. HM58-2]|nr:hypothetical protein MHM582_3501 [Microbacterium sp. HM58-2]